ncbi:hypothetical protein B0O99DRAFT_664832 [Bisporella sp. PMI_857]|nr:hypothetical protein B0O99DRAFT_664832 [Bisporella sp. PMI_857]
MSLFTTPNLASLGSINVPAYLRVPPLINFAAEWTALIPLLAGQVALLGRVSVALFPKHGVLAGMSQLLSRGPDFLDKASTLGPSSRRVWDVKWGGTFPCANGAASSYLAESLLNSNAVIKVPETVLGIQSNHSSAGTASSNNAALTKAPPSMGENLLPKKCAVPQGSPLTPNFRRYQTLHVLHFSKSPRNASWPSKLDKLLSSTLFTAVTFTFKVSLAVIFILFGIYGTAVVLLCSSTTQLVTRAAKVERPSAFLSNNENHDACMLVTTHQNSSVWYLFVGDRGIVDSLLNKTMVVIPQQFAVAGWLKAAHIIQLLAMTFVASQRGWDGVALLILLIISIVVQFRFQREMLTRIFCEENGVTIKHDGFEFSGRTPMLGAIQVVSQCCEWKWMDEILASCPRREVWARALSQGDMQMDSFDEEMRSIHNFRSLVNHFTKRKYLFS